MELTRRKFSKILFTAAVAVLGGMWSIVKRVPVPRFTRAVRPKTFPGRIRPMDEATVRKQSRWSG